MAGAARGRGQVAAVEGLVAWGPSSWRSAKLRPRNRARYPPQRLAIAPAPKQGVSNTRTRGSRCPDTAGTPCLGPARRGMTPCRGAGRTGAQLPGRQAHTWRSREFRNKWPCCALQLAARAGSEAYHPGRQLDRHFRPPCGAVGRDSTLRVTRPARGRTSRVVRRAGVRSRRCVVKGGVPHGREVQAGHGAGQLPCAPDAGGASVQATPRARRRGGVRGPGGSTS